jgi:hypothetical protein
MQAFRIEPCRRSIVNDNGGAVTGAMLHDPLHAVHTAALPKSKRSDLNIVLFQSCVLQCDRFVEAPPHFEHNYTSNA